MYIHELLDRYEVLMAAMGAEMDDDPIDFGPVVHIGRIDINRAVSDLMTVTEVALGERMPVVSEAEAIALLRRTDHRRAGYAA